MRFQREWQPTLRRGPPGSRRRHESIIHDNTEDEFTHETFINAYLASKGADTST